MTVLRAAEQAGFRYEPKPEQADVLVALSAHWFQEEAVRHCASARAGQTVYLFHAGDQWPTQDRELYLVMEAMAKGNLSPQLQGRVQENHNKRSKWLESIPSRYSFDSQENLAEQVKLALGSYQPKVEGVAAIAQEDATRYLQWLQGRCALIEIRGLMVGSERVHNFPIQDLFIPLTTGSTHMERPLRLEEALANPLLVISGNAGSGKTTFLRRLAYELAGGAVKPEQSLRLKEWLFPLLVRIGDLEQHITSDFQSPDWIARYFSKKSKEYNWDLSQEFFAEKLRGGNALLLIDGLDEATKSNRRADFARMIENVRAACPQCRIVVTTRPRAYEKEALLEGFVRADVQDLEPEAIDLFLRHWSAGVNPAAPDKHFEELKAALDAVPEIRLMGRNPLMLTALAVVHYNECRLPDQRAELYESVLGWLAKAREGEGRRPAKQCLELLGQLALAMQSAAGGRLVEVERGIAAGALGKLVGGDKPRLEAEEFLAREEVDSGIITSAGASLKFWHLTFQEYLAARVIAGEEDEKIYEIVKEHGRLYHPEWREVMRLLAGVLLTRQGKSRVHGLFRRIMDSAGATLLSEARCVGLLGAMLRDLRSSGFEPQPEYLAMLREVMWIFSADFPGDIRAKLDAAEAIAQFGDLRLDEDNYVLIPEGEFWMGAQRGDRNSPNYDAAAEEDEAPVRKVNLRAYQIGRYPVTVAEYARYVKDTGTEPPRDWDAQRQHPSRPVVNLTWRKADAYCRWAGGRLPTEAEWERAARGPHTFQYPWGDQKPTKDHANFNETGLRHTTPVGLFPKGATAEGVYDLVGNVWEWVADWYGAHSSDQTDNPVGLAKGKRKVLRGGSFANDAGSLRAACRGDDHPDRRNDFIGFRCVRDP